MVNKYSLPELDVQMIETMRWERYNEKTRKERETQASRELQKRFQKVI